MHQSVSFLEKDYAQLSVCAWLCFSPQLEHCFFSGPVMCVYWLLYDHVQVCTFYQRGLCSYGSRCRYEHVKLSRPVSNNPLPPLPRPSVVALNSSLDTSRAEESSSNTHTQSAWQLTEGKANLGPRFLEEDDEKDVEEIEMPTSNDLSEIPICAFAAAGICPRGDNCPQIHGDLCPTCGKHCLHPFRPSECDNHRQQCERNQKKLEALHKSQEIECSVCLERVLSKPTVAERKFGLMSGCDHPFCVGCIRGWRSGAHAPGMDIDTVVRACPVCRVASHFIVPSVVWYSSSEEKEDIINGYKNKLRCVHENLKLFVLFDVPITTWGFITHLTYYLTDDNLICNCPLRSYSPYYGSV